MVRHSAIGSNWATRDKPDKIFGALLTVKDESPHIKRSDPDPDNVTQPKSWREPERRVALDWAHSWNRKEG